MPLDIPAEGKRTKEPIRTLAESLAPTLAQPSPKSGFGFPIDMWLRRKMVQFWREWEITPTLKKIGFQSARIDSLLESYNQFDATEISYHTQLLSSRLYELMLLGIWLDKYKITF